MTAPKRRWFSFSLRTLFVVVTAFAVWLGCGAWTFQDDERIVWRIVFTVASAFITMILGGAVLTWLVAPSNNQD